MNRFLFLIGLLFAVPVGGLAWLALYTPITSSGLVMLLGAVFLVAALMCAPLGEVISSRLLVIGWGLLILVGFLRLAVAGEGETLTLISLPGGGEARRLNRIFDEQDVSLFGLPVLSRIGMISPQEQVGARGAFLEIYQDMRASEGAIPSPFLNTYMGMQTRERFDVIVIEPESGFASQVAVVFLHGFAGNFNLQCWLVSRAVQIVEGLTVCPSTEYTGSWWEPDGRAILRTTLDYLRSRGLTRVYLAGLSNGGIGASRLASDLEGEIVGLILISGAAPDASVADLPLLVVHGSADERIPPSVGQGIALPAAEFGTYVELQGDHFLLAKHADQVVAVIGDWLLEQESR